MTVVESLLAFTVAASILTVTPGLDTALVLRTAAVGGQRPAALAAVGIGLGCLAWGAIVSLGLGALLAASTIAFTIVKYVGAAYLLWLGLQLLLRPRSTVAPPQENASGAERETRAALRRGFLPNLLNPKVGVFYVTFLPQFIPAGASVASYSFLLAFIHVVLGMLWFAALIAATVPMGRFLSRSHVVKTLDRLCGGIFIAFGVKLALARQP
jgi:threonine/homoserine/homoserine lactone efflux protein